MCGQSNSALFYSLMRYSSIIVVDVTARAPQFNEQRMFQLPLRRVRYGDHHECNVCNAYCININVENWSFEPDH